MTERVQLLIETERIIGLAVNKRANKEGISPSDVVSGILRKALAGEMEEVAGMPSLSDMIQDVMNTKSAS